MSEKNQKCFYCGNDAIAICDSCSPTCATGITPKKPLCEDCIVNGVAINIVRLLIPGRDAMEKIREAQRKIKITKESIERAEIKRSKRSREKKFTL